VRAKGVFLRLLITCFQSLSHESLRLKSLCAPFLYTPQTLLNSILTRDHGKRIAVIENEVSRSFLLLANITRLPLPYAEPLLQAELMQL